MATLTNYKGLEVVDPDPTGAGGLAIQGDLKRLIDWQIVGVLDKDENDPGNLPTPSQGDRYIVGTSPVGAWAGQANNFALYSEYPSPGWQFTTPQTNQPSYVIDEARLYEWSGTAWGPMSGSPAGSDTQVQFNDGGDFGGNASLTYDESTTALSVDNLKLDGNTLSSTDTDGAIIIAPDGDGTIQVDTAGNARGVQAVDLQRTRYNVNQVASGTRSFIAGGENNRAAGIASHAEGSISHATGNYAHAEGRSTLASSGSAHAEGHLTVASGLRSHAQNQETTASGLASHAEGLLSTASGDYTHAGGSGSLSALHGQFAHASGTFVNAGDAQFSKLVARNQTTDATQTELFLDGSSLRATISSDTTWCFQIFAVARRTDVDNESTGWKIEGVIDNNAGTTALVGTPTSTTLGDDSSGTWLIAVDADDTNDSLRIRATGEASKTIRWVASVLLTEVSG